MQAYKENNTHRCFFLGHHWLFHIGFTSVVSHLATEIVVKQHVIATLISLLIQSSYNTSNNFK